MGLARMMMDNGRARHSQSSEDDSPGSNGLRIQRATHWEPSNQTASTVSFTRFQLLYATSSYNPTQDEALAPPIHLRVYAHFG